MEHKSNEQKAKEIAENNRLNYIEGEIGWGAKIVSSEEECYDSAIQAMEWKDKELKNYLDELLAKLNACEKDRTREATIVEIIKGHFFKNVDLI